MSQENPLLNLSFVAGANLSGDATPATSKRYRTVKLSGARTVVETAGATDLMMGVLKNLPASGELADVAVQGTSKVRIGAGGCTVNSYLKLGAADGKFVQGGGGGDKNWAIALEAATADGDVIEAYLLPVAVTT